MKRTKDEPKVDRGLPHNWETERAVLGGVLLNPERLDAVREIVTPDDFHRPAHQHLFTLVLDIAAQGQSPDCILVAEAIEARDMSAKVAGIAYVMALPQACASIDLVEKYARSVRETAIRRRILLFAREIESEVQDGVKPAADLLSVAEAGVFAIGAGLGDDQVPDFATTVDEVGAELRKRAENPGMMPGLPTGFTDLDRMLAGLQRTDLIILAARPAMGKSGLVLNIMLNIAKRGTPVGLFSLEMGRRQMVSRIIVAEGRIDANLVRTGALEPDDWRRWYAAEDIVRGLPILIDDRAGVTIAQLRSRAKRMKAQHPDLGLIVVDYLQLMQGSGKKSNNRENDVSEISRGLKVLAKELDVPVVALSQLNRNLESRADKRPQTSDLRESGALEQDADVILFIFRDEVYNKETPKKGIAEIIIAKQRSGAIGTVELAFIDKYVLFQNLATREAGWAAGYY